MDLSIIIPAFNESESIPILLQEIESILLKTTSQYEIVIIDDGSTDDTWDVIKQHTNDKIKAIRFKKNMGKSLALDVGFKHVFGKVVVTMDADLQDDTHEIPVLYKMIIDDGYDLVSGWKKQRFDPLSKTIPTKLYNWTTRFVSGISLHDFNCGLKAYSIHVVKDISLSGEMHRYIPLLVYHAGYKKIGERIVNHRRRTYGTTKYGGLNRFSNGLLDLISISFFQSTNMFHNLASMSCFINPHRDKITFFHLLYTL